ncbi:XRE family transcriptional regulator [Mycobacterium sp. ACS4331]|uniref:XRE family transcriptional regulator n=1 Tax=Mycobacterium sp. ACS4331 TaxID=1834121 RepID=UPI001E5ABF81|nr:XRE family transcriptional regulator [Mycobacterium sp. ACS4331]
MAARDADRSHGNAVPGRGAERPVEVWPTSAIRSALQDGDISVWQRIVLAIKRDPFGRTARQVEEVLANADLVGVSKAMQEVIARSRQHLEANERAEAARHIRVLMDRSGLSDPEFASRSGIPPQDLAVYLSGKVSPPASLMIRMRRLSDRFAKIQEQRRGRG